MKNIIQSLPFKLSLVSSSVFFLSVMYAQKFGSELWILYGYIQIGIVAFFLTTLIISVVFYFRKRHYYSYSFLPFCINLFFLVITIILPLNWIRNRIDFAINYNTYEVASNIILDSTSDSLQRIYALPEKFSSLSVGGGDVYVVNNKEEKAILFYTFRGAPDGMKGFLKIEKCKNLKSLVGHFRSEIYEIKYLKNNWYYISGN